MKKVAINGFGRIGRLAFRELITSKEIDIVAINDISDAETLSYLLKYDTSHRSYHEDKISFVDNYIVINNIKKVQVLSEKDPACLPWRELEIDLVIECTGLFTSEEKANKHILAGAKKVLISAPAKGDIKTVVYNVNDNIIDGTEKIVSAASCTTNCLAPVLKVIDDNFKIEKGYMTTVHAYTNDQTTLDVPHKKGIISRRGRAAAQNIVPATTGAASAIGLVIPSLKGKMDGNAYRVPVCDGSIVDITLELSKPTSIEEINLLLTSKQNDTLKVTKDPIVSSDVIGKKSGALVDLLSTKVLDVEGKQLIKVVAWYDNEMGYTAQMIRLAKKLMK